MLVYKNGIIKIMYIVKGKDFIYLDYFFKNKRLAKQLHLCYCKESLLHIFILASVKDYPKFAFTVDIYFLLSLL